jgi:hypothetical protein
LGIIVYAIAIVRAVVLTPYLHAMVLRFQNPGVIAQKVKKLRNDKLKREIKKKAYRYSRGFIWPKVAEEYRYI